MENDNDYMNLECAQPRWESDDEGPSTQVLTPLEQHDRDNDGSHIDVRTAGDWHCYCKNLFITYATCTDDPDIVIARMVDHYKDDINYIVAGLEQHEDGTPHIHMLLAMNRRIHMRAGHLHGFVNSVPGGNYSSVRSMKDTANYVCKDKNVYTYQLELPWEEWLKAINSKKNPKASVVAMKIDEGIDIQNICDEEELCGFTLLHLVQMQNYYKYRKLERPLDLTLIHIECSLATPTGSTEDQFWNVMIRDWIMKNFNELRQQRQEQLWISGITNSGKTRLLQSLQSLLEDWEIPSEDWYCTYTDNIHFAWMDEYSGSKTIAWMNQFVGGQTMSLKRKGTHPIIKKKNIPVIILSNEDIDTVYNKATYVKVSALKTRFLEVRIPTGMQIDLLF